MRTSSRLWISLSVLAALAVAAVVVTPSLAPAVPRKAVIELVAYLPRTPVTDGSVDYTARVQAALDAAQGRTLVLAPFPVLVSPPPGKNYCLLVDHTIAIVGSPGSRLVEHTGAVQLLRCENVTGLRIEDFALSGVGGVGHGLGHGTLQLWRCRDVLVRGVRVFDTDADGMAIADSENVRVEHCLVERASKAAIYLSRCASAVVHANVVRDVVGHVAPNGAKVGTGILLLSNREVVCADNVLVGGVGAGILCGAGANLGKPDGATIANNSIRGFANAENPSVASGIALTNVDADTATRVLVCGNEIRECAPHGILAENHDACVIRGNAVYESAWSAISIAHARFVVVADNAIVDANRSNLNGQAGVYLHATASGCQVRGTSVVATDGHVLPAVLDTATPGANQVIP